jgi:DNA modification methylase
MGDKINQRGIMAGVSDRRAEASRKPRFNTPEGLKPKDLVGIPWRLAFALQDAGWYLRSDIIWSKPNPMPESVTDRPTKAHEYIFLLTKSAKYFYNADAIKEAATGNAHARGNGVNPKAKMPGANSRVHVTHTGAKPQSRQNESFSAAVCGLVDERNARTVWTIGTQPYAEAHFATFPEELPRRCIMAGSREGDTVLDPFLGSGTTAAVAVRLGRQYIGIELNEDYAELAKKRIAAETPSLFKETAA